jgi:putative flippase GtrA
VKTSELPPSVELLPPLQNEVTHQRDSGNPAFWQFVRFSMVGILNTLIDVITLNILLWRFPTHNANLLLLYNSLAYTLGALNSFSLNKYWTFKQKRSTTGGEIARFAIINVTGILCNDITIWVVARILHPLISNNILWANVSKLSAIAVTFLVSYLGMRLWVFANNPQAHPKNIPTVVNTAEPQTIGEASEMVHDTNHQKSETNGIFVSTKYSLSVILPAYNEKTAIAGTVQGVVTTLADRLEDFEVIVVNDGSKDQTKAIVQEIAVADPRVRLINHEINQGYGAALVSGFESITKELAFFMDSDGQFDIHDLLPFFPLIEEYDAVLGYRIDRQDTWMRRANAWGWKMLVRLVFGLRIRDVDCAFKLYRSKFFYEHRLETRGAMINTEILYKFTRAGYTYTQVGVHHLPRRGGRATGAKPSVIIRAFRELFVFARKWNREEQEAQPQRKKG